jgi:hypothetical protein
MAFLGLDLFSFSNHTLYDMCWIHKTTGDETFLPIASNNPVPVRIFSVENSHKFTSLHTHIILIPSNECVQYNVATWWILKKQAKL